MGWGGVQDVKEMARLLGESEEDRDALLQEVQLLRSQAGLVCIPHFLSFPCTVSQLARSL